MELVNEFTVQAPIERVWATVGDLRQVAGCLPGAQIDRVETDGTGSEVYHGRVAIKVGPIGLGLAGTATVIERDDSQYRMVVRGSARDRNGQGSADALITVTAAAGSDRAATGVRVVTELDLGGRIAQFGAGMIKQVSGRIVKMFVRKLNALVLQPDGGPTSTIGDPASDPADAAVSLRQRPADNGPAPTPVRTDLVTLGAAAVVVALAAAVFGWSLGRSIGAFPGGRR